MGEAMLSSTLDTNRLISGEVNARVVNQKRLSEFDEDDTMAVLLCYRPCTFVLNSHLRNAAVCMSASHRSFLTKSG